MIGTMEKRMRLSIRTKLIAFSIVGLCVSGVVAVTARLSIGQLSVALSEVQTSGQAIRNHMEADMMHDALRGDVLMSLRAKAPEQHRDALKSVQEHSGRIREMIAANKELSLSETIRSALDEVSRPLDDYIQIASRLVTVAAGNHDEAESLLPRFTEAFESLEGRMSTVSDLIGAEVAIATAHAEASEKSSSRWVLGAMVLATVVSIVSAILLVRLITHPIAILIARVRDIAQGDGDLTRRIDETRGDEIGELGRWFNVFVGKIERVVEEVKVGAKEINAGGAQIASSSQSLAQGASEQASSLQQISASLEEMSGQTQQSAESARQASVLADENKKSADRGQQEMAEMSEAVSEIKQSSGEISKIIRVIDEIAFQTNLLALNAAVEAARAGEAGKGFAVVAEEVRNLAHRSAEAAKNTSTMIEDSVKRSERGVQIARRVGAAFEEITTSTGKVSALLSEIASASIEQATGISQINQGVSQLDQVTQQNAGNSEELASSAEEMSSQVASLSVLVAHFKVSNAAGDGHGQSERKPVPKQVHRPQPAGQGAGAKPRGSAASVPKPSRAKSKEAASPIPMVDDEVLSSF